jgi:hypothetical protein
MVASIQRKYNPEAEKIFVYYLDPELEPDPEPQFGIIVPRSQSPKKYLTTPHHCKVQFQKICRHLGWESLQHREHWL